MVLGLTASPCFQKHHSWLGGREKQQSLLCHAEGQRSWCNNVACGSCHRVEECVPKGKGPHGPPLKNANRLKTPTVIKKKILWLHRSRERKGNKGLSTRAHSRSHNKWKPKFAYLVKQVKRIGTGTSARLQSIGNWEGCPEAAACSSKLPL